MTAKGRVRRWRRDAPRRSRRIDWKGIGAAVVFVMGWWDARHHPDQRTDAVASLSTNVAQQQQADHEALVSVAQSVGELRRRITGLERAPSRGTLRASSPAPPMRDPGLAASIGRLFTFWRHKDGR